MRLREVGIERGPQSLENLFQVEYEKAIENIIDIRTYPEEKRKIQITLTLQPREERTKMILHYDIKTVLSPIVGGHTEIEIEECEDGTYITRPSISKGKLKGQIDVRDMLPDADGVYSGDGD
jgi:hypothetical protein